MANWWLAPCARPWPTWRRGPRRRTRSWCSEPVPPVSPVKVISHQPPGGRCTLYARYADAIAGTLGWSHAIVHDECRDAHGTGFPSLWIGDAAIQPADGAILTPEDICDWLRQQGVETRRADALQLRLQAVLDDFLENWKPESPGGK